MTICRRRRDGSYWRPSHPEEWSDADATASLLRGERTWFFRRVELVEAYWGLPFLKIQFRPSFWRRTGETWAFGDSSGANAFDVLRDREARKAWRSSRDESLTAP